ncbi:MAG: hypothetical protein QG629_705 [Patescibacteria group bacterium]|nr:hypothetical protein [Candidatus Saccharibacteria bacterium]MDQ5963622.1 hypothetical protein [Patescibacteria group bacterium]
MFLKKDERGVTHHFILPVVAFVLVGAAGLFVAKASNVDTMNATNATALRTKTKTATIVVPYRKPQQDPNYLTPDAPTSKTYCESPYAYSPDSDSCINPVGIANKCKQKMKTDNANIVNIKRVGKNVKVTCSGNQTKAKTTRRSSQSAKPSPSTVGANGISYGVCMSKGRAWNKATNNCDRRCTNPNNAITNLSGNQIDYCRSRATTAAAPAASTVGSNGISYGTCVAKHRAWSNNTCQRTCAPNWSNLTNLPGNQIDYCRTYNPRAVGM